jgi:hypothetical protein
VNDRVASGKRLEDLTLIPNIPDQVANMIGLGLARLIEDEHIVNCSSVISGRQFSNNPATSLPGAASNNNLHAAALLPRYGSVVVLAVNDGAT